MICVYFKLLGSFFFPLLFSFIVFAFCLFDKEDLESCPICCSDPPQCFLVCLLILIVFVIISKPVNCSCDYFDGQKCLIFLYLFLCEFHFLFETLSFECQPPRFALSLLIPHKQFRNAVKKCVNCKCFQLSLRKADKQWFKQGVLKLQHTSESPRGFV